MNALPKQKATTAPTAHQLRAQLTELKRQRSEATRLNNAAKVELQNRVAEGNPERIEWGREDIANSAKRIADLTQDIDATEGAVRKAEADERAAINVRNYVALQKTVADARKKIEDLGDAGKNLAKALKAALAALQSVDGEMLAAGVTPDPYILQAKLKGILDLALHLESDGLLGAARTLESPDQLRRSGRACLMRAAQEFHTLTMQRIRGSLHITQEGA
jgi:chromosome segregation ATPase